MPRIKDDAPAVRVYTVCDESKYLIVRNVPALGCRDELLKLFGTFGEVEECNPMDAEECEAFTDVYWIKFHQVNNARFAKRKLDESVFLGNRLQISYAQQYESLSDAKEKLEGRRREVSARLNRSSSKHSYFVTYPTKSAGRSKGSVGHSTDSFNEPLLVPSPSQANTISHPTNSQQRHSGELQHHFQTQDSSSRAMVSSNEDYFPIQSMNQTVKLVREKLNKIQSSAETSEAGPAKKIRVDNRRRI